jgi:hypothetical protein
MVDRRIELALACGEFEIPVSSTAAASEELQIQNRTQIMDLRVVLRFRSSQKRSLQNDANFGNAARAAELVEPFVKGRLA